MAGTGGSGGALPAITIWLAGDSTMANGSAPCPIGWGADFQALFTSGATVKNSAIAGRSVRTWLYSVQSVMDATGECVLDLNADGTPVLSSSWQAMLTGMKTGDYLFIQFGINDSDSTCPRHVGTAAFETSYGMMAQAATDRGAHPVFITPPSSISCSGTTAVATRGAYVPATKDAGTKDSVPVVDLNALTVALYKAMSFCPVPGGDVSATTTGPVGDFFCDDHTHFSATGAPQIAALVAQAIRSLGLPLAAYLK
jgi:lysophospholipase L1-like esterase